MVLDWYEVTLAQLQELWVGLVAFVPQLVGALVVFVVGWIIAVIVGRVVADILRRIQFNQLFEREGFRRALERADMKVDPSEFIGGIFKWVLLIVFVLAAVEILGLNELAGFLSDVLGYLPNVLVASLIFVFAVVIADIVGKFLHATVESAQMGSGHYVAVIVKWSIWIFAIIAILLQLGVARDFLLLVLQGVVAFFVVAAGLSFGLAGKDVAGELLRDMMKKLKG
ncbi:MAG: hypothetical protein A3B24_01960 [Candidatus Wildermuthbacteria bacterium RIFCSPLOWO2_01_FULL_48_16]|uniref:Small-conductance mechanosensitive ion channel n=1 Tax=Candidatus Wildermuthbacteria bacterium RIFCSPLOWO2_01_FULL_48_16 TaxID=1802461 RepID=A0A1G2RL91_9BACT|nr:MAG: hypothetical protein A3J57_01695 [Candidatus Wildermuthbacteria bacterium RIFCSPHIGHO2_02_FULL_49_12b]OHA73258.1 MAG: hypothetical protein A3B24_01960 [Candidatus Wildermuthbacteria bacterium RIFCSPLOWO2_01_FULL_48_16]